MRKYLSNKTPIEEEITRNLLSGNEKAMALIYDNYSAALYGVCRKMLLSTEDSEEVFQEVMVKIWKAGKSFDPNKARLYTWMVNIARNTCIDLMRKNNRRPQIQDTDSNVHVIEQKNHNTEFPVDHIGLKEEIAKLRKEDRNVLELAYFSGYSQGEIAKKLNHPLGTVKTRARKAINELKTLLARDIGR
ncbi:MAG: RNA polymerase subunit sigma-70 [Bacteroidetes bacterium]|nr:MAG: RNA polymerase subunit sigma-70 [Bacteroidota bacterium]